MQLQEPGAEFETAGLGGGQIDRKLDPASFHKQTDDASPLAEIAAVGHGQHRAVIEGLQQRLLQRGLRPGHEQHMATGRFLRGIHQAHPQAATLGLSAFQTAQFRLHGVMAVDAEFQGKIGAAEGLRRPLDEFGEVIDKRGLDFGLFRRG